MLAPTLIIVPSRPNFETSTISAQKPNIYIFNFTMAIDQNLCFIADEENSRRIGGGNSQNPNLGTVFKARVP